MWTRALTRGSSQGKCVGGGVSGPHLQFPALVFLLAQGRLLRKVTQEFATKRSLRRPLLVRHAPRRLRLRGGVAEACRKKEAFPMRPCSLTSLRWCALMALAWLALTGCGSPSAGNSWNSSADAGVGIDATSPTESGTQEADGMAPADGSPFLFSWTGPPGPTADPRATIRSTAKVAPVRRVRRRAIVTRAPARRRESARANSASRPARAQRASWEARGALVPARARRPHALPRTRSAAPCRTAAAESLTVERAQVAMSAPAEGAPRETPAELLRANRRPASA